MVDIYGNWVPEEDYATYPKEKWCDMDRIANYIMAQSYDPKTSIANLAYTILAYFESEIEDESSQYRPGYDDEMNINIPNLAAYVDGSGGLEEFDYIC